MQSSGTYTEEKVLSYSDFDMNDQILFSHIAALFQDVAGNHSQSLGCGYETMKAKDMIWIIARARIDVIKQPMVAKPILVETIAYKPQGLIFDRQFFVKDKETGEVLITGITSWCIASLSTRRLVRPSIDTNSFEQIDELPYKRLLKLPDIDYSQSTPYEHTVQFVELDHNRHMNNTHYLDIATNMIRMENDNEITSMEINYEKECSFKDTMKVYLSSKDDFVIATNKETNLVIFKVRYQTK